MSLETMMSDPLRAAVARAELNVAELSQSIDKIAAYFDYIGRPDLYTAIVNGLHPSHTGHEENLADITRIYDNDDGMKKFISELGCMQDD